MNNLISEIKANILRDFGEKEFANLLEYKELKEIKEITLNTFSGEETRTVSVWTKAIQKALDENKNVYIPKMDETIYIDSSIIVRSGYNLKVDEEQRISLIPDTALCMVRNENIISGQDHGVYMENPDENISIEGGIWDSIEYDHGIGNGNKRLRSDSENSMHGVFTIMLLSNIKNVILKNITFANSHSYAVQICNCVGFHIENIHFDNMHRDGIHVNGPAKYGYVGNLFGENMGDDMVALNAWDWDHSAMSFGTIEKMFIENLHSTHNEFRLLPGRKTYSKIEKVDCELKDLVIRNIEGVYTFKLYGQPNVQNVSDCSEIPGNIKNVYFDNIIFPEITDSGFHGLPVKGLFEVCADTKDIHLDNIKINNTVADFKLKDVAVVKAGPLSAVWTNDSDNPEDWTEVFAPNDICTLDDTYIGKIEFLDRAATKEDLPIIAKAIKLSINEDYPNTIPKGGTGYGIINDIIFE